MHSTSVNNICILLQLLEDFVPRSLLGRLRPWTPLGDFRPPGAQAPPNEYPWRRQCSE